MRWVEGNVETKIQRKRKYENMTGGKETHRKSKKKCKERKNIKGRGQRKQRDGKKERQTDRTNGMKGKWSME